MTTATQENFLTTAAGKYFDPDGVYKFQCVDVAIAYAMACFPAVSWEKTFGRGNANMHYPKNNQWWESIPNVVGDLTSVPRRGDIVIWGGDSFNPYGHIAVVVSADAYSMQVLQQNADGSGRLPTQLATMGYDQPGTGGVVGWLRPKLAAAPAPKPVIPAASATLNGIDISMHQKGIDVGRTGAQFALVKATEGVGYADPQWAANVASARRAGALVGHYHFARPVTAENTPKAEADWFVSQVRPQFGADDLLVLDWEAENVQNTAWAKEFLDRVSSAMGVKPLIYMNQNAANTHDWSKVKPVYPLWLAQYPSNAAQSWGPLNAVPSVPGWNLVMWQYTQTGRLSGYGADLDLNVFYGDAAKWRTLAAGGKVTPVVPTKPVVTVPTTAGAPTQCVVEAGDTLSGIAAQFKVALADLIKVNPGINPDLIYPGQVLTLPGKGGPVTTPGAVSQCVVEPGDTLAGIATQFGVDLNALISLNKISNPNLIFPGQVLALPPKKAAPKPATKPVAKPVVKPAPKVTQVVVEPDDTLSGIAAQWKVSLPALIAKNGITNPDYIQVGQVLNLP